MDAATPEPTPDVYAICLQGTSAVAREGLRKEVQALLGADFRLVCAEDTGDAEGPSLGALATSVHVRRDLLEGPRAGGSEPRLRLGLANVNLPARRCPARGKGHPHFLCEVTEALARAAGQAGNSGSSDLTLVLGDLSLDGAEATLAAAHAEQACIVAQQPTLPPGGASAACVEFSSDFRVQGFEEGYGTDASGRDRVIYKALNGTAVRVGAYVACRPVMHEIWHTCHRPVSQVLDVALSH